MLLGVGSGASSVLERQPPLYLALRRYPAMSAAEPSMRIARPPFVAVLGSGFSAGDPCQSEDAH